MKKITAILFLTLASSLFTICEAQYQVLHNFDIADGANPFGNVTMIGGKFFGMTSAGGSLGLGCVFSMDTTGNNYKVLLTFADSNGSTPRGSLSYYGNVLYGMTSAGGKHNKGVIFSIDTDASNYKMLHFFSDTDGATPFGSLTYSAGILYGMTQYGGKYTDGRIFSIDTDGTAFTKLLDFNDTDGATPYGSLLLSGGKLYGMTRIGGAFNDGCIFSINTNGSGYMDLLDFNGYSGDAPAGSLTISQSGTVLYGMSELANGSINPWGNIFSMNTDGSNFKIIYFFNGTAGELPWGDLTLSGHKLFGMTSYGGPDTNGIIFMIDTDGTNFNDLYNFQTASGNKPYGSFAQSGTNLYGMTSAGVADGAGVIFKYGDLNASTNQLRAKSEEVRVYPNPGNGVFTLQWLVDGGQWSVKVYNVLGENIYSNNYPLSTNHYSLDLSSNPSGVYFYKLTDETGNVIGVGKVVIQK